MVKQRQLKWPSIAQNWVNQSYHCTAEATADGVKVLNIPYGDQPHQVLDIYLPAVMRCVELPVIAFIHGGFFTNGDQLLCGHMAPGITALPAIFVSIGYRLAPQVRFLQQADDIALAVSWLYRHIADYGGDANNLVLSGHSSGGGLASWTALHTDRLEQLGCPSNVIKACMPVSGVYDFNNSVPRVTRFALDSMADAYDCSAVNNTHGNYVPFIVTRAENDFDELKVDHDLMCERLAQSPAPVSSLIVPNQEHFSITFNLAQRDSEWYARLKNVCA